MLHTYSILVTGKVQGVFYRQATKEKAKALGIYGTVMNEGEDHVAIVATGSKEQLDELVEWCREGPPKAHVQDVIIKEIPLQQFGNFTIVHL